MRLHRFYVGAGIKLSHDFWLHDERLIHQWSRVLRFVAGQEVVLFDGLKNDKLYKIQELDNKEAHLSYVTDLEPKTPAKNIYLLWALLKKDKNDWVLQKCTELGVSHFIPLLADRSEKTGFNLERAQKIVIEASEQCGRSDIPLVREPMHLKTAIEELNKKITLFVAEQGSKLTDVKLQNLSEIGVFIGPEGGWSEAEKGLFKTIKINHLSLHDFTLRAETACVAAVTKLLQ